MWVDNFWVQALFFALLLVAAVGNMRTGRFGLGFAQFVLGWLLADGALVMRFVFEETGPAFTRTVLALQVCATVGIATYAFGRIRRRLTGFRDRQDQRYLDALDRFMAGDDEAAIAGLRRIVRKDPWDGQARAMLATVHAANGRRRAALRWYRRSAALLADGEWRDEIEEEIRCLQRKKAAPAKQRKPDAVNRSGRHRKAAVGEAGS